MFHFKNNIAWEDVIRSCEQDFADYQEYEKNKPEELAYAPSNTEEALANYEAALDSIGDIAGNFVSARAMQMDKEGLGYEKGRVIFPQAMVECCDKIAQAGLIPYGIGRYVGGLHLSVTAQMMLIELVSRSDMSLGVCVGAPNIAEIAEYCQSEEIVQEYLPKISAGKYWSAMALTEPDYGSDLSNIQCKAQKDAQGTWRINGTKRFITHGCGFADKPALIFTLARTGSSENGARALSFFLVRSQDVEIAGIEKKLGIHCSPTCEVVYHDSPALLLGKEGYGLVKYAMNMMNSARAAIAAQAVGAAQAAFFEARKYAGERRQFGRLIQDIPSVRKILDRIEREVAAMRCMLYETSRFIDLCQWTKRAMDRGEPLPAGEVFEKANVRKYEKLANFFTPLAKCYTSEMCNSVVYDALQVFGGAGYTEEYDIARIYRDARILTIYEGTTQLQIVAIISQFLAGMGEQGHIRKYIQEARAIFPFSLALEKLCEKFEQLVSAFKELQGSQTRDSVADNAVEAIIRLIGSLLLEKSTHFCTGDEQRSKRQEMANAYHVDSLVSITSQLLHIEEISKLSKLKKHAVSV